MASSGLRNNTLPYLEMVNEVTILIEVDQKNFPIQQEICVLQFAQWNVDIL